MARLIDADKLKMHYAWWADAGNADMRDAFDTIIDLQPTVDPTKHGRWIRKEESVDGLKWYISRCSCCKSARPAKLLDEPFEFNYCPNCGAKMNEVENG